MARCTVARLMGAMGLEGIIRGKPIRTTVSDKAWRPRPLDALIARSMPRSQHAMGLRLQCAAASGVRDGGGSPAIGLQEQVMTTVSGFGQKPGS